MSFEGSTPPNDVVEICRRSWPILMSKSQTMVGAWICMTRWCPCCRRNLPYCFRNATVGDELQLSIPAASAAGNACCRKRVCEPATVCVNHNGVFIIENTSLDTKIKSLCEIVKKILAILWFDLINIQIRSIEYAQPEQRSIRSFLGL